MVVGSAALDGSTPSGNPTIEGEGRKLERRAEHQPCGSHAISVAGTRGQTHGSFGPVPAYMMSIGVSPHDEIVFAPYREGPHELWIARLR